MLKLGSQVVTEGGHVDVGFRDLSRFGFPFEAGHDVPGWPDNLGQILIGDEHCGPAFHFITTIAGRDFEMLPAHMHGSDSWRISLLGEFRMGNVSYAPGEFRLQRGWKNYPGDTYSIGPDGGWLALVFADRRGMRMRLAQEAAVEPTDELGMPVSHDPAAAMAVPWVQATIGLDNDFFSDMTSEESAIVSSLSEPERGWHVNSSFDHALQWEHTRNGCDVAGIVMGQKERGPLMLLARTKPGATSSSACAVGTELIRLVVRGSASIAGRVYETGDCRIELAGAECPEVVAGPDGLDEVLIFGDRRAVTPSRVGEGWTTRLDGLAERLVEELSALVTAGAAV